MAVDELETEFKLSEEVNARLEKLKKKQPEYFKNIQSMFEAFDNLEKEFINHLEDEQRFLEVLPTKIQEYVEKRKDVLKLRKEILELTKT